MQFFWPYLVFCRENQDSRGVQRLAGTCGIVHFITWATRALIAASLVSAVLTASAISTGCVDLFKAPGFIASIAAVFLPIAGPYLGNAYPRINAFELMGRTRVLLLHKWITRDLIRAISAINIPITLPELADTLVAGRT